MYRQCSTACAFQPSTVGVLLMFPSPLSSGHRSRGEPPSQGSTSCLKFLSSRHRGLGRGSVSSMSRWNGRLFAMAWMRSENLRLHERAELQGLRLVGVRKRRMAFGARRQNLAAMHAAPQGSPGKPGLARCWSSQRPRAVLSARAESRTHRSCVAYRPPRRNLLRPASKQAPV
jgi:hypothetical protein